MTESGRALGRGFADFELDIGDPDEVGAYPVTVRSGSGTLRCQLRLPFDDRELEKHLDEVEKALLRSVGSFRLALSEEQGVVRGFGQALFESLLPTEARGLYYQSRVAAQHQGKAGVRLKIRIRQGKGTAKLMALPWEFLYDPRDGRHLCLAANTPVVREIDLPHAVMPLSVRPPLRVLAMVASPRGLPTLDVEHEQRQVEGAIADLREQGLVELTWLAGQTWQDLKKAMYRGPWHVFHFVGHGVFDELADEGLIALPDETGEVRPLKASSLGLLLANEPSLRLVVLNACQGGKGSARDVFSSTGAILLQQGIPAVVAMQYQITDRAASEFARGFYEAIAHGRPVDAAVGDGRQCVAVQFPGTVEWATPVLYMRAPDGALFDIDLNSDARRIAGWSTALAEAEAAADWDAACEVGERILAVDGGHQPTTARTAAARRERGATYLLAGNLEGAAADLRRALELEPDNADAHALLATVYAEANRLDRAVEWFERAIRIDGGVAWYHAGMGQAELRRGHDRAASECLDRAIERDPENAAYVALRAVADYRLGEFARATAQVSRAIEFDGDNASYWWLRGVTHGALGDHRSAVADLTRSTELDSGQPESYGYRGTSAVCLCDYRLGEADLAQAARLDPRGDSGEWAALLASVSRTSRMARLACRVGRSAPTYVVESLPTALTSPLDAAWAVACWRDSRAVVDSFARRREMLRTP